jgi:chorismate-pyruvate lyase
MADPKITYPGLLHPLSMMRRGHGLPSLDFKEIESQELPEPYKQLLAHEGDMTSRLEDAYRSSIRVNRLRSSNDGKNYFRDVILETSESPSRAVEYGAIEIQLSNLPDLAKEAVIGGEKPLGGILNEGRIPYACELRGFFKVIPDESIQKAFAMETPVELFGRSNRIKARLGDTIAMIVEILPPA